MERSFLEGLGIESGAIEKIMTEYGKDVTAFKNDLATKESEIKAANSTIESLQESVKKFDGVDVDGLQKTVADLKVKHEAELAAAQRDAALNLALSGARAKNPALLAKLLDREKIALKDGKLEGLDEQLEGLRKENAFLFAETEGDDTTRINTGGNHGGGSGSEPTGVEAAFLQKNPGIKLDD